MAQELSDRHVIRTARTPMALLTVGCCVVGIFLCLGQPDPEDPVWVVIVWIFRALTLAGIVSGVRQFFRPSQLVLTRAGLFYTDVFGHRIEVLWSDIQDLAIYEQVQWHNGLFKTTTRYVGWTYTDRYKAAGRWKPNWWMRISKAMTGLDWTLPRYWTLSPGELLQTLKHWAGRA